MSRSRNIRDQIVARRRERIAAEGHSLGASVPDERTVPVAPFLSPPGVICEIKRRSPSRGPIDAGLDPVALAGRYREAGARSLSVLTEEDHFAGSLDDLTVVKQSWPDLAILRKDFLLDPIDIQISYRAGADAVLLIAAILSKDQLFELHEAATESGMVALVELHDEDDFEKAALVKPSLVGINARNLATFQVDLLTPIRLRSRITWPHRCVFESGILHAEDAATVSMNRFEGVLVGEAAVRRPGGVGEIISSFREPTTIGPVVHPEGTFWSRLMERADAHQNRPLAKVCGITRREDAELAVSLGADLLGFMFAKSSRRAGLALLREVSDLCVLKVAIVAGERGGKIDPEVAEALRAGLIDVVQLHGFESPSECATIAFPYYKVVSIGAPQDAALIAEYRCPRVLIDARDPSARGGTGKRIPNELVRAAADQGPLWLAGGLSPDNIRSVTETYRPELVDLSSGLESAPGRKDPQLLRRFFEQLSYSKR